MGSRGPWLVVRWWADDAYLAGERIGTAQTVNLPAVGRSKDRKDCLLASSRVRGYVRFFQIDALAGATPQYGASDRLRHGILASFTLPYGRYRRRERAA